MPVLSAFLTGLRSDYNAFTVCIVPDNATVLGPSPELLERLSMCSDDNCSTKETKPLHEPQHDRSMQENVEVPITKVFTITDNCWSQTKGANRNRVGTELKSHRKQRKQLQHQEAKLLDNTSKPRISKGSGRPQKHTSSTILRQNKKVASINGYGQIQLSLGETSSPRVACSPMPPTA